MSGSSISFLLLSSTPLHPLYNLPGSTLEVEGAVLYAFGVVTGGRPDGPPASTPASPFSMFGWAISKAGWIRRSAPTRIGAAVAFGASDARIGIFLIAAKPDNALSWR